MLEKIKELTKDTAIYGISTIVGRFLGFFLIPFYTNVINTHDFGIYSNIYAYLAFLNIFFIYGMDAAFMKYASLKEDKTEKKNLQFRYGKLKDVISKEINEYGKRNPKFLKEWREANEGYATIQDSKKFTRFLESHIGKLPRRIAEGIVIEAFLGHPQLAAGTAASFVGIKTGEVLYRVAKSPTLRSHYINVVKSAGEENLPAMIRSLSKLEAGL